MGERSKYGGRCHSKQQWLLINGRNGNPMAIRSDATAWRVKTLNNII